MTILFGGVSIDLYYDPSDQQVRFSCGEYSCCTPWSLLKDGTYSSVELFWGSCYASGSFEWDFDEGELSEAIAVLSVARMWIQGRRPEGWEIGQPLVEDLEEEWA